MPLNVRFFSLKLCQNSTDEWCCSHGTGAEAGLFQGIGTFVRQLPSATSSVSSSTTTTATQSTTTGQSSSATSTCPSSSVQAAPTGYIAAISVISIVFAITLAALLSSLYRLRTLRRSFQVPVQSQGGGGSAPQGRDELPVGATYHEVHAKEAPQELHP